MSKSLNQPTFFLHLSNALTVFPSFCLSFVTAVSVSFFLTFNLSYFFFSKSLSLSFYCYVPLSLSNPNEECGSLTCPKAFLTLKPHNIRLNVIEVENMTGKKGITEVWLDEKRCFEIFDSSAVLRNTFCELNF